MPPKGRSRVTKQVSDAQRKAREEKERIEDLKMKLIELVRDNPVLYDTAHPDHLNVTITDVIWEEIAANLGVDGMKTFINMRKFDLFIYSQVKHLHQHLDYI